MKQNTNYIAVLFVLLSMSVLVNPAGAADTAEYAWVLQEVLQTTPHTPSIDPDEPFPVAVYENTAHYTDWVELHETWAEIRKTAPGSSAGHVPMDIHVVYRWTPPPEVIRPGDTVAMPIDIDVINNETGGYGSTFSLGVRLGQHWPMLIATPAAWQGLQYATIGAPWSSRSAQDAIHLEESAQIQWEREAWSAGRPGTQQTIRLSLPERTMLGYVYQWAPVPEPQTGYTAWQPDSAGEDRSERFYTFFAEVEALVRLGEEYRAASPDYLEDFHALLEKYRPDPR